MMGECARYRVILMGNGGCGKTTIIHSYLFDYATGKYKETVEDVYTQRYTFNGKRTYIDFLDTAGNIPFPSMQDIYIRRACGFILVYSITDKRSFSELRRLWNRIKEVRKDILDIPCVVIGNNLDRAEFRKVEKSYALNWCYKENLGGCMMELSAREGYGIDSIFNILLQQFGNRRASQWKPQNVIQITKDVTDKISTKKERKKKSKSEKQVRETNINERSQNISFDDIVFDEYSKMNIKRRFTVEDLEMNRIKPVQKHHKERKSHKSKLSRTGQPHLFRRLLNRFDMWRKK